MIFGNNAKIVFKIICEFYSQVESLGSELDHIKPSAQPITEYYKCKDVDNPSMHTYFYLITLKSILDDFILIENFTEEKLFNTICDHYNKKLTKDEDEQLINLHPNYVEGYWQGLEDFIQNREVLEIEKELFGYRYLKHLYLLHTRAKK